MRSPLLLFMFLLLLAGCGSSHSTPVAGSVVTPPVPTAPPATPAPPVSPTPVAINPPMGAGGGTAKLDPVATGLAQRPILSMAVRTIAFSPDGKLLASGSGEGEIVIWDVARSEVKQRWIGHDHWVFDIEFDKDGQRLLTAGGDNKVNIWSTEDWRLLQTFEDHDDDVHGVAITSNGRWLVTGSDDMLVIVRDLETGEARKLAGHEAQVTSVRITPDDQRILSSSRDETVRVWELATGRELAVLKGHQEDVLEINLDETGKRLLSASYDGTVRLWSLETFQCDAELKIGDDWILSAIWPRGREIIVSGDRAGTIRATTLTGQPQFQFKLESSISDFDFSPGGEKLAVASAHSGIQLLEVQSQQFVPLQKLRMEKSDGELRIAVSVPEYLDMHEALLTQMETADWSAKVGKLSLCGDQFTRYLLEQLDIDGLPAPKKEMAHRLEDKLEPYASTLYESKHFGYLAIAELTNHPVAGHLKAWLTDATELLRDPKFAVGTAEGEKVRSRFTKYAQEVRFELGEGAPLPEEISERMLELYNELSETVPVEN